MARLPVSQLKTSTRELDLGSAKVYHLPNWHSLSHPQRLGIIRQLSMMRGRDPRIAKLAVSILKKYNTKPRQYDLQAAALLKWIQTPKNFYYVNEPGERLQDPIYSIDVRHGDCDDAAGLLCALFESINLPWKLCLSGRDAQGKKVRHIEGQAIQPGCTWSHIYCMVGTPPFQPSRWFFCEPTVEGVPLGWDVVDGDHSYLPEMARQTTSGPPQVMRPLPASTRFVPSQMPPPDRTSPAYAMAMGGDLGGPDGGTGMAISGALAEEVETTGKLDWTKIGAAVVTGVTVSLLTQAVSKFAADWWNGTGAWENEGRVSERWDKSIQKLENESVLMTGLK